MLRWIRVEKDSGIAIDEYCGKCLLKANWKYVETLSAVGIFASLIHFLSLHVFDDLLGLKQLQADYAGIRHNWCTIQKPFNSTKTSIHFPIKPIVRSLSRHKAASLIIFKSFPFGLTYVQFFIPQPFFLASLPNWIVEGLLPKAVFDAKERKQ